MTKHNVQRAAAPRKSPSASDKISDADRVMFAICRLANGRTWFEDRGWKVLPQNERGHRILEWGAFHAHVASPANPERSVRRWCRRWAPWLTAADLAFLVVQTADAVDRGAKWSHDESAVTLCIGWRDRERLRLWHVGANDDPDYEHRNALALEKDAARKRRSRAERATAGRGRPGLGLSEQEMAERRRAQNAERSRAARARKAAATVTQKSVRPLILNIIVDTNIDDRTDLSVTRPPDRPSRAAPKPSRRLAPIPSVFIDDDLEHAAFACAAAATTNRLIERRSP